MKMLCRIILMIMICMYGMLWDVGVVGECFWKVFVGFL